MRLSAMREEKRQTNKQANRISLPAPKTRVQLREGKRIDGNNMPEIGCNSLLETTGSREEDILWLAIVSGPLVTLFEVATRGLNPARKQLEGILAKDQRVSHLSPAKISVRPGSNANCNRSRAAAGKADASRA